MPELQELATELGDVELVTVILGNTAPARAISTAQRLDLRAPILRGDDALRRDFQVQVYPWTIILDRKGKPVLAYRGAHAKAELRGAIEKYL